MDISKLLCETRECDGVRPKAVSSIDQTPGSQLPSTHVETFQGQGKPAATQGSSDAPTTKTARSRISACATDRSKREVVTLHVVPDKERKRGYRLSAKQRKKRLEHQAYESRVYNLTLDINALRQQVRFLEERRDLHVTRLLLARQKFQAAALDLASSLVRVMQHHTCGSFNLAPGEKYFFFARVHPLLTHPSAGGRDGVPGFVIHKWDAYKQFFTDRACATTAVRVLSVLDAEVDDMEEKHRHIDEEQQLARKICGPGGGCVVEAELEMSGRLTRQALSRLAPDAMSDEHLVAKLISQRLSWWVRKRMYINGQGLLVHKDMEANTYESFANLFKAAVDACHAPNTRFQEVEDLAHENAGSANVVEECDDSGEIAPGG